MKDDTAFFWAMMAAGFFFMGISMIIVMACQR